MFLYKPRLDGLRSIAILMVLIEHFAYFIGKHIAAGFYGVNLFFVLSGFLITSILLESGNKSFIEIYKNFISRRALRIFPIYYLSVLFLYILNVPGINRDIGYLVTYIFNYKLGATQDWSVVYTPYWSLSVEEQFYLIYPLLVIYFRNKLKIILSITVCLILVAYSQLFTGMLFNPALNYIHLLTNMAPLGLGAFGAIILKMKIVDFKLFDSFYLEFAALILLIFVLLSGSANLHWFFCSIINLYLVLKCSVSKFYISLIDRYLLSKFSIRIGKVSYGIYLYHMIIGFYFSHYIFNPLWYKIPFEHLGLFSKLEYNSWIIKFPLFSFITIIIAHLSYQVIEKPLLLLKDKYFKTN